MSDPVNSSDEAVEAALVACNAPDVLDLRDALIKAFPIFAAAVRAEAVADERRRIVKQVRAAKDEQVRAFGRDPGAYFAGRVDGLEDAARVVAAGSVPVATPPAEPAAPRLWPCEHGERGWHRTDDNRHCLGGAAPSQPVTCEHGKTRQHYEFLTGCWCPGPVSVPKESSE